MNEPARLAQALVNLDAWLETMRQEGGYGGPVAHWWQNRYRYTGPGLDWRYEGVLIGYVTLRQKTHAPRWCARLRCAAKDLLAGQGADGSYRASSFEMNPRSLGTPHEAAATLGLLSALPYLEDKRQALEAAKRNLDNLIAKLWDGRGFNDRPGVSGRVPNKLATLAQALMTYAVVSGDDHYLPYARAALEDVLRYQVTGGRFDGAVHQYAPGAGRGDGRFFPFYAARCVPPLVLASTLFLEPRYRAAAERILDFIRRSMSPDGSWPQIVYGGGQQADWPRWLAGSADILLAYGTLDEELPAAALERLLGSQLPSGGFPTAQGFSSQISQRAPVGPPDYRDVTPVVGWNDKVLRLLAELLEAGTQLPEAKVGEVTASVTVCGKRAALYENNYHMSICPEHGDVLYAWGKDKPWAQTVGVGVEVR